MIEFLNYILIGFDKYLLGLEMAKQIYMLLPGYYKSQFLDKRIGDSSFPVNNMSNMNKYINKEEAKRPKIKK